MAPYKKSEITVDENASPLLDSNWLRIYNNKVIKVQTFSCDC